MDGKIILPVDFNLEFLKINKESGYNYRERRQEDWRENYTLYRDKVTVNRLEQRQSVNLPLMKQTLKTLLKDVDDMPVIYFENLDNDKQAEIFLNEYWKWTIEMNRMELKDIVDKKQDMFFGRSFDQMQIADGMVKFTIQEPEDILVDRYLDPADLDSARFLIHTHIFVPLSDLEKNKEYDQKAVHDLKMWHISDKGLMKAHDNQDMLQRKQQKMSDLGLSDVYDPVLSETYVELSLHFVYKKEAGSEEQLWLFVEADDKVILLKKPLEQIIGTTKDHYWRNHFPYNTWADDLDRQDFWSDGIADMVRTPNKVINSWFSQLVENRTLRNFGMHYFDSTIEGFQPQTFSPVAWGWYGVPGKPQDVLQKVDIPDLSESLDEMEFIIQMTEKSTGATATQQGAQTERQITLGEVQLALGEAKERIKGMSKYYTQVWKDRAYKFLKLIEAAPDKLDAVTINKKGKNTDAQFTREITPKDWRTKAGYTIKIWSQDEKKTQDSQAIEKLNAVVTNIPGNPKLLEVYQRKLLEFADLKPEEVNAIMEFENQRREMMTSQIANDPMLQAGLPIASPQQQQQPIKPMQRPATA